MPQNTPWSAWLGAGLRLGLPPRDFWALSFKEWRALAAPGERGALRRAEFEALATRYPDISHG